MFYSPNKQFVRFSTYRTAQIKALRERIQKEKITPEQINTTQLRLDRLKQQYQLLQKEEHSNLREVLRNSELAITELQKEISLSEKQSSSKKQQIDELERFKNELQDKGAQVQEVLYKTTAQKDRLGAIYLKNQQAMQQMEVESETAYKELQKQKVILADITVASAALQQKLTDQKKYSEQCFKNKMNLAKDISTEREGLKRLKKQWQLCQKEAEKQKLLLQLSKQKQELYFQKMNNYSTATKTSKQCSETLSESNEMKLCLSKILDKFSNEFQRMQLEDSSYKQRILQVQERVNEQEATKLKLQEKVTMVRANLRLYRQKNDNLRSKMNAIFKNDSELVRMLTAKKAYPHVKSELVDTIKKSVLQPLQGKQNTIPVFNKQKPQAGLEMRPLGEVNRAL